MAECRARSSGNGTGSQEQPQTVVLFFRNDLRLHDNVLVLEAAERAAADPHVQVVPLYCFEPRLFGSTPRGYPKTGPFRTQFLLQSVAALRASLRGIGSDLLTTDSAPQQAVSELLDATDGTVTVLTQQEVTNEELEADAAIQAVLQQRGGDNSTTLQFQLKALWGASLLHIDDLPFGQRCEDMPHVFTKFRLKVEEPEHWRVRPQLPPPQRGQLPLPAGGLPRLPSAFEPRGLEDLQELAQRAGGPPLPEPEDHPEALMRFEGGEEAGLERLRHYLWETLVWDTGAASTYFDTRNGLLAVDDSTKLSPWLALGCLSPRRVHAEIVRYEAAHGANKSTYFLTFHLLVRDYFRFFCLKHGSRVFHEGGVTGERRVWRGDADALRRWKDGATGIPFVDAHMRELQHTGWMSNRGRQNVASYLALDLEEDWRQGADWFESRLVDYDVCSNWGNWVAAAGLTPGRTSRFNLVKQSKDYDADGRYIRRWVPELAAVPTEHIHQTWRMTKEEQQRCGVQLPADYPLPIPGTRYHEAS